MDAQGQQMPPVTYITDEHYRVDKTYIFLGPATATFLVILIGGASNAQGLIELYFAAADGLIPVSVPVLLGLIGVALVALFALLLLMYWLAYKNMSYAFGEREFSFYSGIFVKKHVHLPYERVQSVNYRSSLVQRLAGVCTVMIDSAGGSSNKGVRVPYVRMEVAERMRSELFVRKAAASAAAVTAGPAAAGIFANEPYGHVAPAGQTADPAGQGAQAGPVAQVQDGAMAQDGAQVQVDVSPSNTPNAFDTAFGAVGEWRGAFGGAAYVEEPVSYELRLTNKQLLLASFTHPGPLIGGFAVLMGMICVAVSLFFADEELPAFLVALFIPGVVGSALVTWLLGCLGILLGYGNFKACRRGTRIEVERGLVTKHFSGIDISRVQSVEIRQSVLLRLLDHSEVSLGRIDVEESEGSSQKGTVSQGLIIHPFLPSGQIEEILQGLVPEFNDRPVLSECALLPKQALRRAVLRRAVWFNWFLWGGIAGLVALALVKYGAQTYGLIASRFQGSFEVFMLFSMGVVGLTILVGTALMIVGAVLWAEHSCYGWSKRFLLLHNDGITTSTSLVPRQKIQAGYTRSNPFQRHWGLATLAAITAAGYNSTEVDLMDVTQEAADEYLRWLQ